MPITAQQLNTGRSVEEVFQFGHDLEFWKGVRSSSGAYLSHYFFSGALIVSPTTKELIHLPCHALTTGGFGLCDAFCQTARQNKSLTRREALSLCPQIVN
jgi:hypothetical protein